MYGKGSKVPDYKSYGVSSGITNAAQRGLPSIISASKNEVTEAPPFDTHGSFWTERRANRHAKSYFGEHYKVNWGAIQGRYRRWDEKLKINIWTPYTVEDIYPTYSLKNLSMKKWLLFYMSCIVVCSCKYSCPEYNQSDKSTIAFRHNDTITYISNENDTIKLLVFNTYFEGATSWRGIAMDVECRPQAYYEASDETANIYIKEQQGDWEFYAFFGNDTPYVFYFRTFEKEKDIKCVCTADKAIEGNAYSFVIEVEDLSGQRRIDKFIKVDFYGIIEFHDKTTGLTWRQEIKQRNA